MGRGEGCKQVGRQASMQASERAGRRQHGSCQPRYPPPTGCELLRAVCCACASTSKRHDTADASASAAALTVPSAGETRPPPRYTSRMGRTPPGYSAGCTHRPRNLARGEEHAYGKSLGRVVDVRHEQQRSKDVWWSHCLSAKPAFLRVGARASLSQASYPVRNSRPADDRRAEEHGYGYAQDRI